MATMTLDPFQPIPDLEEDRRSLRQESLRVFTSVAFVIAFLWSLYLATANDGRPVAWLAPFGLVATSGVTWWLARSRVSMACVLFPVQLLVVILAYLWSEPYSLAHFFVTPVVIVASVTCSRRWLVAITAGTCALLLLTAWLKEGSVQPVCRMAVLVIAFTALAVWLATRNLHTALGWALYSHNQARVSVAALRERQADLRRLADMLGQNQERLHYLNLHLEQARVAAEEAYRTKQHFVANVSHELRTPLNLITGFSEMMAFFPESYSNVPLPPQYRQDMLEIYRSSKHLLGLIEDVLSLAQLEAGQMIVRCEWADITSVIQEATETMRPLVEAKGLALEVSCGSSLPLLCVDAGRIRQILLNLLNNAYRFTERGKITVSVGREQDQVITAVRDSGVGIAPEDLPHIFEEFHSLSKGPAARRNGFGLGLAISRKLVEAHNGRLWAVSELGRGSSFYVALPITQTARAAVRPTLVRTANNPHPDLQQVKPVILAVEREQVCTIFDHHLSEYQVVHVSPEETPAACEHFLPVAIWINEQSISSETLRALAPVLQASPTVPVISCRIPTQEELARELRADLFLPKPISSERISNALSDLAQERPIHSVLIVDDDPRMVRLLHKMLISNKRPRYRIIQACGGREGLELLQEMKPDAVLLDLSMPEVSGYDILEFLHQQPEYRQVRTIVMSGVRLVEEDSLVYALSVQSQAGFSLLRSLNVVNSAVKELSDRVVFADRLQPQGLQGH